MKQIFKFLLSVIIVFSTAYGQQLNKDTLTPVKVKDWGLKSFAVYEPFWMRTKEDIISKVGKEKYELIKKYTDSKNIPSALWIWDGNRRVEQNEYRKRLNSLRVYRVVNFQYKADDGEIFDYTILSIPYQELYWDYKAKWDTIFFMIRSEAIEN